MSLIGLSALHLFGKPSNDNTFDLCVREDDLPSCGLAEGIYCSPFCTGLACTDGLIHMAPVRIVGVVEKARNMRLEGCSSRSS